MAALVRERAAIGEDTARELDTERGQEARDRVEAAVVLAHASTWDAAQEADGVRVAGVLENRLHRSPITGVRQARGSIRCPGRLEGGTVWIPAR